MEDLLTLNEWGEDTGRGNLIGVQTTFSPQEYRSEESFTNALRSALLPARHRGWLSEKTIVIFGEYVGTWLLLAGASAVSGRLLGVRSAMLALNAQNGVRFAKMMSKSIPVKDKLTYATFASNSEKMATLYQRCFEKVAREFKVTIVAGSTILASPVVKNGKLLATDGPLELVSGVFAPDGSLHETLVQKSRLVFREQEFISEKWCAQRPLFHTPAGRLGVLICADSWYDECYDAFGNEVDIIAVPAYLQGVENKMSEAWKGYDGHPDLAKFDASDIGKLSEYEAWCKYSLPGKIEGSGAKVGMIVFNRDKLWGVPTDGNVIAVNYGKRFESPRAGVQRTACLWI